MTVNIQHNVTRVITKDAVRGEWKKSPSGRIQRTDEIFDKLHILFSDPKLTCKDIAVLYDVSDQTIFAIYETYFKKIFGGLTMKQRRAQDKNTERSQTTLEKPRHEERELVEAAARAQGMQIERIRAKGKIQGPKPQNQRLLERWFCVYLTSCLENRLDVRIVCPCGPKRKGLKMVSNGISVMSARRNSEVKDTPRE